MRRAQMHNRDVPVPNKLTAMRDRDRSYGMHRDRLRTIKPAIDNRAPPRRPHIRAKLKRRQLIEEWYDRVNRENRLLLERMASIAQRESDDYRNDSVRYSHSLNSSQRRRLLSKIAEENYSILSRLQEAKPTYDAQQWEEDLAEHEERKHRISSFSGSHSQTSGSITMSTLMSRRSGTMRSRRGGSALPRPGTSVRPSEALPNLRYALPKRPPTASAASHHQREQQHMAGDGAVRSRARSGGTVRRARAPSGRKAPKGGRRSGHDGKQLLPSPAGQSRHGRVPSRGSPKQARPEPSKSNGGDAGPSAGAQDGQVKTGESADAGAASGGDATSAKAGAAPLVETDVDEKEDAEVILRVQAAARANFARRRVASMRAAQEASSREDSPTSKEGEAAGTEADGAAEKEATPSTGVGAADAPAAREQAGEGAPGAEAGEASEAEEDGGGEDAEELGPTEEENAAAKRIQAISRGRAARQDVAMAREQLQRELRQPGRQTQFEAGSRVEARFGGGVAMFAGTVQAVNADGTLAIAYDDGDREDAVPLAFVHALPPRLSDPERIRSYLVPGVRVLARFGGGADWFPGRILAGDADQGFSIAYDDGDREDGVQLPLVRLTDSTPLERGTRVEARFGGGAQYFSGVVTAVSGDGNSVDIYFDDGDSQQGLPRAFVRAIR